MTELRDFYGEIVTDVDDTDKRLARLKMLREQFPANAIGHLPRKQGGRQIYIDYIGHAAVTDRLLLVDPCWRWEPVAFDERGAPLIVPSGEENVALWIRLTVCGVDRLGVGIVPKDAHDREKQLVSDSLRNAAMRFGVGLDLWSKEDLSAPEDDVDQRPAYERLGYSTEEAMTGPKNAVKKIVLDHGVTEDFKQWRREQGLPWPLPSDALDAFEAWLAERVPLEQQNREVVVTE